MLTRRQLFRDALLAAGAALGGPLLGKALAMGQASRLRLATLRYGGNWNTRTGALQRVLEQVDLRTSVLVTFDAGAAAADQTTIFQFPLLWMSGDLDVQPFSEQAVENLQRHMGFGGTLFADDTSGRADSAFAQSLRGELERVFPGRKLEPLPADHAVFRSYYYLARVAGRSRVSPRLEGITVDDRTVAIFSANDLSGVLENLRPEAEFGLGGIQSEEEVLAVRQAVNIVMYALTVNYKLDQVHVSYQLSHPESYPRLRRRPDEPQR